MENNKSNLGRDFLLIILSVILSITGILVANNYGLISLGKNTNTIEINRESTSSLIQAKAKARSCSVSVWCNLNDNLNTSAGSGIIMNLDSTSKTAYVLTNHHVINEVASNEIHISLADASNIYIKATLLGTDPENDIAVISFSTNFSNQIFSTNALQNNQIKNKLNLILPTLRCATIGRSIENLIYGETVFAIGNALGIPNTQTDGNLSDPLYFDNNGIETAYLQTSAAINGGNSGGGLFDANGNLIGINTLKITNAESIGFCLPVIYDSTISLTTANYNPEKRCAISSYLTLLSTHNQLVSSSATNTIGYIPEQNTAGAVFETILVEENNKNVNNVYITNVYEYYEAESSTTTCTGRLATETWQEPSLDADDSTIQYYDFINEVQFCETVNGVYETATYNSTQLKHNAASTYSFSAVELMSYINSKTEGFLQFTVKIKKLNTTTSTLSDYGTRSIKAEIKQFQYEFSV